ncbi:MAG TPA: hypothetical protein DDW85_02310 [Porphyromonadaceae bacterium]|nr:hypothetical protein [Porphyromonadaceae bacterium]
MQKESKNRVHYPEYWKKKKLAPMLLKQLEETVNSEPVVIDEHGEYREGVFLHRCYIVVVKMMDGLWLLQISGSVSVLLQTMKEIRYKYIPDDCLMAQLFPSRKDMQDEFNVSLYQIPGSNQSTDNDKSNAICRN